MVNSKHFRFPLLFIFAILVCAISAMATITFNSPSTTNEVLYSTEDFNVTTDLLSAENCTWSTTDDANFAITTNTTESQLIFENLTFDTTALTEVSSTTLTVLCTNLSGSTDSGTLTVKVDNTAPVCSYSIDPASGITNYQDPIGIVTTQSSTDTTTLTYAWRLERSDLSASATSTSSAPTFNLNDLDQIDNFNLNLVVTDEAGLSTACTNETIFVKSNDDAGRTITISDYTDGVDIVEEDNTGLILFILISGVVVLGSAGYFLIFMGRKKKR